MQALEDTDPQPVTETTTPTLHSPWKDRQHDYGHAFPTVKPDHTIRVMLQNLQQLPVIGMADCSTQLMANIKDHQPDILLFNDIGLCWKNIPIQDSWKERSRGRIPHHAFRFSYNKHEDKQEAVQWGGTGVVCLDQARHRMHKQMGSDPDNLGRWTWVRLQGRHGFFVRIVSAYKPCKNTSDIGSSYQQQLRYFRAKQEFTCPLKLFDLHLKHQLQEWIDEREHIILGVDLNEDVRTGPTSRMLRELGLKDAITDLHHPSVPPETNYKNVQGRPIDAIFVSRMIEPAEGGYLPYMHFMDSDHRALWIDIPYTSILDHNFPDMHRREFPCIRPKDPRSVRTFHKWAHRGMKRPGNTILKDIRTLQSMKKQGGPVEEIIAIHAQISEQNNANRKWATQKTKKVFAGKCA